MRNGPDSEEPGPFLTAGVYDQEAECRMTTAKNPITTVRAIMIHPSDA